MAQSTVTPALSPTVISSAAVPSPTREGSDIVTQPASGDKLEKVVPSIVTSTKAVGDRGLL